MPYQILKAGERMPTSDYKGVYPYLHQKRYVHFTALITIKGKFYKRTFHTEKAAAKFIDLALIKCGKEPVNILKRKND